MPKLINEKHERFAAYVAAGSLTLAAAYVSAGYRVKTSNAANASAGRLLRQVPIAARIAELRPQAAEVVAAVIAKDLRTRTGRAAVLQARHDKLEQFIAERAASQPPGPVAQSEDGAPIEVAVPGWRTGLVVAKQRSLGKDLPVVVEYELDRATLSALLDTELRISEELGQRVDKTDLVTRYGSMRDVPLEVLKRWEAEADAEIAAKAAAAAKAKGVVN